MFVYSGRCKLCETGREAELRTVDGDKLFTGDIVVIYTYDVENGDLTGLIDGLTCVVDDSDPCGTNYNSDSVFNLEPFVMGLKKCIPVKLFGEWYLKNNESQFSSYWIVKRVKSYKDVVDGEKWDNFGFNFKDV